MTLEHFIEQTKDIPRHTVIVAYDPEDENIIPVTGLLFTPSVDDVHILEICTDDNS